MSNNFDGTYTLVFNETVTVTNTNPVNGMLMFSTGQNAWVEAQFNATGTGTTFLIQDVNADPDCTFCCTTTFPNSVETDDVPLYPQLLTIA